MCLTYTDSLLKLKEVDMKRHIPWNLIRSYLKKEMTQEEDALFSEWISVPENKLLFRHIEKLWIAVLASSSAYQPDTSYYWDKMKKRIEAGRTPPFVISYKRIILYAASFVGIVWGAVYTWKLLTYQEPLAAIEMVQRPDSTSNTIQLVLSKQESIPLTGEDANVIYDKSGNIKVNSKNLKVAKKQDEQVRSDNGHVSKEPKFNQLVVPVGKRSSLVLADGTKIWVNSGSRVVYPVAFEKEKREIYVDGEVFLDVTENKACPFIVSRRWPTLKPSPLPWQV